MSAPSPRLLVVVQARMGSTRLPGKVLLPLAGRPLLARQIERLAAVRAPFELCVATTPAVEDEPIRELCRELGVACVAGHPTDLLDRHLSCAKQFDAEIIAKIPSDCPLIDPAAVEQVFGFARAHAAEFDFVTNLNPPTWPDGNDVEVMTRSALETAHREAQRPLEREHTTPFIWENPQRFRIANVRWSCDLDLSKSHRFTIDHPEDYEFIARVYQALCRPKRPVFGLAEILLLLAERPELSRINQHLNGQSWHMAQLAELRTVRRGDAGLEWGQALGT